jgi:hypothetical protein
MKPAYHRQESRVQFIKHATYPYGDLGILEPPKLKRAKYIKLKLILKILSKMYTKQ